MATDWAHSSLLQGIDDNQAGSVTVTQTGAIGRIVVNAAIVSAGVAGETNLVLDTNAYFGPTRNTPALSFSITPCRIADTRNANARAFSPNLTAVPREFLTIWPADGPQPLVSTLNSLQVVIAINGYFAAN